MYHVYRPLGFLMTSLYALHNVTTNECDRVTANQCGSPWPMMFTLRTGSTLFGDNFNSFIYQGQEGLHVCRRYFYFVFLVSCNFWWTLPMFVGGTLSGDSWSLRKARNLCGIHNTHCSSPRLTKLLWNCWQSEIDNLNCNWQSRFQFSSLLQCSTRVKCKKQYVFA